MAVKTNSSSKFTPFSLSLSNNATLEGIAHVPPLASWTTNTPRPLIVALHGGTCTAHHYDVSPDYTSSTTSAATGVPIISINRPCYAGTSTFLPLPEEGGDRSFFSMTASWLHQYILPAIWETFGVPNNCGGIVLLSHSLAVPPSILTAALYAGDMPPPSNYILAGMILSGFGAPETGKNMATPTLGDNPDKISFAPETRRLMMISESELNCADPAIFPLIDAQTVGMPREEIEDMGSSWPDRWEDAAQQVEVPILYRMGEHDWLWKSDEETMEKFRQPFGKCKRFDSGVMRGAPHGFEIWSNAQEWYDLVFRFAIESCESI